MLVARTIDLPSRRPLSSGREVRPGTAARAALAAAIFALALALLGWAYYGTGIDVSSPDPTGQWTD